jgi:hypothetical protein
MMEFSEWLSETDDKACGNLLHNASRLFDEKFLTENATAKIEARQRLNSLPPKEAQAIVNEVLRADEFIPDLSHEIDWDEIPTSDFVLEPMVKKTPQEIIAVLTKIPASSETVLVGGHAINFWATAYQDRIPELESYLPFSSEDLDFIGGKVEATEFQEVLGGKLTFPAAFSPTPNTAILMSKSGNDNLRIDGETGGTCFRICNRHVDFLANAYGLDTEQIASSALPFNSTKLPGVRIKVLNPILCLTGKLKSYTGLPQYGRQDRKRKGAVLRVSRESNLCKKHLEIAVLVVRQFIQEFCIQNKPRQGLKLIEKLATTAKSEAGLKVWQQDQIDILRAVPIDALNSFSGEQWQKFRKLRLPQLLREVADKRTRYAQIVENQLERKQQTKPSQDIEGYGD